MSQQSVVVKSPVEVIIERIDRQREDIFAELIGMTNRNLWYRSGEGEWSIGENLDHMGVIYNSILPFFRFV